MINLRALKSRVRRAEGTGPMRGGRHMLYQDTRGELTIGYGFLLRDGLSPAAAAFLLDEELRDALSDAASLPWFADLSPARQEAIVEMLYQLGLPKFRGFGRAIAALKVGDYALAADEFLRSAWARQTPARAQRLATVIRTGVETP